jgi:hypothetical protein
MMPTFADEAAFAVRIVESYEEPEVLQGYY